MNTEWVGTWQLNSLAYLGCPVLSSNKAVYRQYLSYVPIQLTDSWHIKAAKNPIQRKQNKL